MSAGLPESVVAELLAGGIVAAIKRVGDNPERRVAVVAEHLDALICAGEDGEERTWTEEIDALLYGQGDLARVIRSLPVPQAQLTITLALLDQTEGLNEKLDGLLEIILTEALAGAERQAMHDEAMHRLMDRARNELAALGARVDAQTEMTRKEALANTERQAVHDEAMHQRFDSLDEQVTALHSSPPPTKPTAPPPISHFTGRDEAIDAILKKLDDAGQVGLVAVQALGGMGKTATALEIANTHADRFPDPVSSGRPSGRSPTAWCGSPTG